MVYRRRVLPNIPVPPPVAPNPGSNPPASNTVKGKPMEWKGSGNFDIGQETAGGGHGFTGLNIVNVTVMTPAQLVEAAKETNYELKRLAIQKRQHEIMIRIAAATTTVNEFSDGCYEEPFLTMDEVPPFDGLSQVDYNTIESIRADLATGMAEICADIANREAVKKQIGELGGPVPLLPTEESPVPTEIDKVKEKLGDVEQDAKKTLPAEIDGVKGRITEAEKHLVPTPGTPETVEDLPDPWPPEIPERPTVPVPLEQHNFWESQLEDKKLADYLTALLAYEENKQFIMGWCLEQIRVCLNDLSRAKAPGTQEDAFKANIEGLSEGVAALEEAGVFHD